MKKLLLKTTSKVQVVRLLRYYTTPISLYLFPVLQAELVLERKLKITLNLYFVFVSERNDEVIF